MLIGSIIESRLRRRALKTPSAPSRRCSASGRNSSRFASQWDVPHDAEPAGWAQFHIVTTGNCLLERSGGHPLRLEAGDVLLLPHGNAHVVRSSARTRGPKSPIRIEYGNAIETKTNTKGKAATELICGRLHFEAATDSLVIATLPDVIVRPSSPLRPFARKDGRL